jgi:hypothetical protein
MSGLRSDANPLAGGELMALAAAVEAARLDGSARPHGFAGLLDAA